MADDTQGPTASRLSGRVEAFTAGKNVARLVGNALVLAGFGSNLAGLVLLRGNLLGAGLLIAIGFALILASILVARRAPPGTVWSIPEDDSGGGPEAARNDAPARGTRESIGAPRSISRFTLPGFTFMLPHASLVGSLAIGVAAACTVVYLMCLGVTIGFPVLYHCSLADYLRLAVVWLAPFAVMIIVEALVILAIGSPRWMLTPLPAWVLVTGATVLTSYREPGDSRWLAWLTLVLSLFVIVVAGFTAAAAGKSRPPLQPAVLALGLAANLLGVSVILGVGAGVAVRQSSRPTISVRLSRQTLPLAANEILALNDEFILQVFPGGAIWSVSREKVERISQLSGGSWRAGIEMGRERQTYVVMANAESDWAVSLGTTELARAESRDRAVDVAKALALARTPSVVRIYGADGAVEEERIFPAPRSTAAGHPVSPR